ncbi:hypothetical protein EON65_22140 [archaeon]|nr:MAG: hypothetical protein EON65_22140 [archaeon]
MKNVQDIVFYDIVPVDHLLARLAEDRDNDELCSSMTELLVNSYFPQNSTDKLERVHRCIQFVNENSLAAESFYRHLYKHSSIGSVSKLSAMLFTVLLTGPCSPAPEVQVEPTGKNAKRQRNGGKKAPALVTVAEDNPGETSLIPDVPCFLKVLRLTTVLVQSIQPVLKDHASSLNLLLKYINVKSLKQLLAVAMSQPTHREYLVAGALQLISSTSVVDSSIAEGLTFDLLLNEICLPQLRQTEDEQTARIVMSCFVDAALNMGFEVPLLEEITHSLVAFASNIRSKKQQEPHILLHAVSSIALLLAERRCNVIANDNNSKVR